MEQLNIDEMKGDLKKTHMCSSTVLNSPAEGWSQPQTSNREGVRVGEHGQNVVTQPVGSWWPLVVSSSRQIVQGRKTRGLP